MAQKTRAQLQAENAALFVENTTGDITPTLEKAYNEDVNDSCMLLAEGTYTTISLVDWTALVAANGLVPGWQYLVTGAYTSSLYGVTWDVLVEANSPNTVSQGWVKGTNSFSPIYVSCQLEADFGNVILNECPVQLALTADQLLSVSDHFNFGVVIPFLDSSNNMYEGQIAGDDAATIILNNVKTIASSYGYGVFGVYTPQTAPAAADDTFTPNASVWAPTPTSDGSVVTSPGTLSAGKISKNGNVMSYSFLLTGVTMDFTGSNTGFVTIPDTDFPFLPTGEHVVSGQLSEPGVVGIAAISGSNLRINFVNRSGLTLTTDVSINGQCLL